MKDNIEIYKAINIMAKFLEKEPKDIVGSLAFLDKEKFKKIADAYNSVILFYEKPLEERARVMGFEVEKEGENITVTSTI